ncbi:hypothetical protein OG323_37200 (plasmid) [Streptomyces cyaneofuscatus]|nr:hypothetical protein OG323_00100 [Streptomyces cyaneofuscatus]WTA94208.1 hypothetical protein OG323_37005 [Streptomyces cyaneofuscatus]WTA94666.1 hypothetical protein OG323_37200 [Streptomyces cyaneofuscatus]
MRGQEDGQAVQDADLSGFQALLDLLAVGEPDAVDRQLAALGADQVAR